MTALAALGEGLAEISLVAGSDAAALGFGGDAANVCVMAARLGASARLVGRVGDDPLGRRLRAFWEQNGVDLACLHDDAAPTGLYVNEAGPKTHGFAYWRNGSAGSRLCPDDLRPELFDDLGALLFTGVTLAISRSAAAAADLAARRARACGALVVCVVNHRPALGGDVAELADAARASDVVISSREDAEAVFGTAEPGALAARLGRRPSELVLTDGGRPAVLVERGAALAQPIPAVAVRNAGGAGDALAGAYLAARLRGEAPSRSLAWGVAAATVSVQRDGCAAAYPTAEETVALLRELAPATPLALDEAVA